MKRTVSEDVTDGRSSVYVEYIFEKGEGLPEDVLRILVEDLKRSSVHQRVMVMVGDETTLRQKQWSWMTDSKSIITRILKENGCDRQKDFENLTGIPQSNISRLQSGKTGVPRKLARKLLKLADENIISIPPEIQHQLSLI